MIIKDLLKEATISFYIDTDGVLKIQKPPAGDFLKK